MCAPRSQGLMDPTPHTTSGTSLLPRDSSTAAEIVMEEEHQPRQRRSRKRDRSPPTPLSGNVNGLVRGGQEEEEVRDEDVDRFYALLADFRGMRELWRRNGDDIMTKKTSVDDGQKKQDHQQLWRPTFVMEDFTFELKGSQVVQPENKVDSAPNLDLSLSISTAAEIVMEEEHQPRQRRSRKRDRSPPTPLSGNVNGLVRGGQEEEEVRDEDVDRFYALLADFRGMRELWRRNGDDIMTKKTSVDDGQKKQDHQQLWRPTFVMEDFTFELKGSQVVQPENKVDSAPNLDLSLSM
uniref:Uncharacterized protein n=1 Tax=Oryza punctata TaxID=4537 RepID=A0A0E0JJD9_ORYPU